MARETSTAAFLKSIQRLATSTLGAEAPDVAKMFGHLEKPQLKNMAAFAEVLLVMVDAEAKYAHLPLPERVNRARPKLYAKLQSFYFADLELEISAYGPNKGGAPQKFDPSSADVQLVADVNALRERNCMTVRSACVCLMTTPKYGNRYGGQSADALRKRYARASSRLEE